MGPAILTTIGVIALVDSFRNVGFFGYVGGILLVIGGVKLFQGGASTAGHQESPTSGPGSASGEGGTPVPPVPPSEVSHG